MYTYFGVRAELLSARSIEVRWHGRGGQGAVTASIILSEAANYEGLYAQAFPEFGPERRGAPVKAYTRISRDPIRSRAPVRSPDIVVVLDPTIPHQLFLQGLKEDGVLVINTKLSATDISVKLKVSRVVTIDATGVALKILKTPIVNIAMLGALARVLRIVSLESLARATLKTLFNIKFEGSLETLRKTSILGEAALGNIEVLVEAYRLAEVFEA